jgi:hypothetical protein
VAVTADPPYPADEIKFSKVDVVPSSKEHQRSFLSALRRFWIPIAMVLLGAGLFPVSFFWVLPSTAEVISPSPLSFVVNSPAPIIEIDYAAKTTNYGSVIDVTVLTLPNNVRLLNRQHATILLDLPAGVSFYCTTPSCRNHPPYLEQVDLTFSTYYSKLGMASVEYPISQYNFVTRNDIQEKVGIPGVHYIGPGQPALIFGYFKLPSASFYDWSSFPPSHITIEKWFRWDGSLTNGIWLSRTAVGVNYANQQRDFQLTFLAGALVGLAAMPLSVS